MDKEIKLYRFTGDAGRESLLLATPHQVKQAIGQYVMIGEKGGWLEASDFEAVEIPLDAVIALQKAFGSTITGLNPIAFLKKKGVIQ